MKIILCLLILFLACWNAKAQDMYLEYKMSGVMAGTSKTYISPLGMRIESEMVLPQLGKMSSVSIMTKSKGTMISFDNKSNTYTEMKIPNSPNLDKMSYAIKVVGNEKVNGYNCAHAIITMSKGINMEMWTTKEVKGYQIMAELSKTNDSFGSQKMYQLLKDKGADGFLVKSKMGDGKRGMMMDLVKIEQKNNPASLFTPPSGYKKAP
jgi:hypothetical protein